MGAILDVLSVKSTIGLTLAAMNDSNVATIPTMMVAIGNIFIACGCVAFFVYTGGCAVLYLQQKTPFIIVSTRCTVLWNRNIHLPIRAS